MDFEPGDKVRVIKTSFIKLPLNSEWIVHKNIGGYLQLEGNKLPSGKYREYYLHRFELVIEKEDSSGYTRTQQKVIRKIKEMDLRFNKNQQSKGNQYASI